MPFSSHWINAAIEDAIVAHQSLHGDRHRDRVVDQLVEESCELLKELMKHRRADLGDCQPPSPTRIGEEIADVLVCVEFLCRYYKISDAEIEAGVHLIALNLGIKIRRKIAIDRAISDPDSSTRAIVENAL